ncbi:MAG TPA: TMEM43 family protein [Tepidisphaeraceae bacterium]|jgi:hypothetical protein
MSQVFTELTREGYLGRVGRSIRAVVVGLVFLAAAAVLLFWNEGRTVRTANMLTEAPPGPVCVIGEQTGGTVAAYTTPSGGSIELLRVGAHPATEMIATEQQRNAALTWLVRLVGFVLMWMAIFLMLQPLKVVASVAGILGDLVGVGVGLVSLLGAATLSAGIIAIAWLVYRPLLGAGLLAVAGAAAAGLFLLWQRRAAARRAALPLPAIGPVPQHQ